MKVYKLIGARQASYGIGPIRGNWLTIRESFGDYSLSVEIGRPDHVVEELPDDATDEQMFDTLANLENLGRTWAEQQALYRQYEALDTNE